MRSGFTHPRVNPGGVGINRVGVTHSQTFRNNHKAVQQVKRARARKLSRAIDETDVDKFISLAKTGKFNSIHDNAYKARQGYSIGDVNGEKVMYVSGSRNAVDWALNAIGPIIPKKRRYIQKATARRLHKIAVDRDVDVVIGHSRGGALVSAMPGRGYKKASVDGAMIIANDKSIFNVAQDQPFDRVIGYGGENTHYVKAGKLKNWHFVMRP